ncbi:MAG: GntR family transcriptional regulator [Oscillospiraceae bacterium]|nr:GntR family transcriptional regulator [Oscillospiraceae bacterium]
MRIEQIHLDKTAPLPLAEQLAGELLRRIVSGELRAGEKLPTERELAERLQIARGTVKRAYARLSGLGAIVVRQGSGSYVQENGALLEETQKQEAAELLIATIARLRDMGMSDKEIWSLMRLKLRPLESGRKIAVMVLSNNYGILSELEAQLGYLTGSTGVNYTLSFTTLASISASRDPVELLLGYDLIVATSVDYPAVLDLTPMYRHKLIEVTLAPRTRTLMELGDLPRDRVVSIIYRTNIFLNLVRETLTALGFDESRILTYQEADYSPALHGAHGEAAIIGFNEAPMYVSPAYKTKNERFVASGGRLIRFEYRIDRGSLGHIEDRISALLT